MAKSIVARRSNPLTPQEKKRLKQLEKIIKAGLDTCDKARREVGESLAEINDKLLYREQYSTFEEYCREEWGYSRSYAYRLMSKTEMKQGLLPPGNKNGAGGKNKMSPMGDTCEDSNEVISPEEYNVTVEQLNEAQARELVPVPAEQRAKVLECAIWAAKQDGKPLTAGHIKEMAGYQLQINAQQARDAQIEASMKDGTWKPEPGSFFHEAIEQGKRLDAARANPKPSTNSLRGQEERISESFFVIKTISLWKEDRRKPSFEAYFEELIGRLRQELSIRQPAVN